MSMTTRMAVVVAKKEIVDNFRDRRAMSTALVMPLLGPLTMLAFFFALKDAEEKSRAPIIPVIGRDNAPELVLWLERQGTKIETAPADPDKAVRDGTFDAVLRIPAGFDASLRKGEPAVLELICDPSRQNSMPTLGRIDGLLTAYGGQIGALRLMARGVDPGIASALRIERVDVGAPDAKKALLLASLPLFLLMTCFLGGTYVAIDITAGERERGSLEPLLLNPVSARAFVLGKVFATIVFGVLSMLVGLAAYAIIVPAVPFEEIGIYLRIPPRVVGSYALLFLPTVVLASALQVFVGTLSKTTKTAQASLGFLVILPMIPSIIVTLFPQQPSLANSMVPCLGESILALRLLRGEDVDVAFWIVNAGADLLLASVLVVVTTRLFGARMLSS